ncbi:MAG: Dabb family protein, partial [Bacteroidota bacterium]
EKTIDADAEPGLIHTVYFWLNDDVDADAAKDFAEGVWDLEAIPSVKRMFVGPAASTPSRDVVDNSFDYALILWFDDVAGHDAYQVHDIHTKFVEEQGAKFKKVRVRDNVLQEMK